MADDNEHDRAARAAGEAAVQRFRALMDGRETAPDPKGVFVETLESNRPVAGSVLRDYRLLRELGSGGLGTVFLAERSDGTFVKNVAIKMLRGLATDDGRNRLRAERQILAELEHPGIARLLDGGETSDGQPFIVLEYIEGDTLYAGVAKHKLDLNARVHLFRQIAEAVAHAHQRLVVHRDLKPNNVLVTATQSPRLLDFGIARLLAHASDDQSTRVYTVGYASPEQKAGGRITTRSDVYALGVILFELATSQRFEGGATEMEPVRADADVIGIARKAASSDPADRYATVDAMLDDLTRWRDGMPVRARSYTTLYRASRFVRRHRAGAVMTVIAIASLVFFLVRLERENARAHRAEQAALEAKELAQRDADRARRLLDFVSQTFDAASPDNARGATASASELVAEAEERLATTNDIAEDKRAIQLMLADLASRLGETDRAMRLSAAAVASLPEVTGKRGASDALRAWQTRASALREAGESPAAVTAARTAETLAERFFPEGSQERSTAQLTLGLALAGNADESARPILDRVIAQPSFDDITRMRASSALVSLAVELEDGATAMQELTRTKELARSLSPTHPLRVPIVHLEANALELLGRYDEALVLLRTAIADRERDFGKRGAVVALLYNELASILSNMGHFRDAAIAVEQAIALLAEVHNEGMSTVLAVGNAASIVDANGDYARAEQLTRESILKSEGMAPSYRRRLESNLARIHAVLGRFDLARAELAHLRDEAAAEDASSIETGRDGLRLAQVETWAGNGKAARAALERAAPAFAKFPPAFMVYVARTEAETRLLEGRSAEAVTLLDTTLTEATGIWGDDAFDTACIRLSLASALIADGKNKRAEAVLAQALPVIRGAVLPAERNRVAAEALAHRLGMAAPALEKR